MTGSTHHAPDRTSVLGLLVYSDLITGWEHVEAVLPDPAAATGVVVNLEGRVGGPLQQVTQAVAGGEENDTSMKGLVNEGEK